MENYEYAVELEHITKIFGDFKANDDVTIRLRKGEIHALLGENGAGKSTLMNVLFGLNIPDQGEVKVNGKKVQITNPNDATNYGIGMVHQHFKQVECFTVLQNIVLGMEDVKGIGVVTMDKARQKVLELSERYHFQIDPDALISDITVGMQQRVEILKMLYRDNDVLIFDEPTAVLTPQEINELLQLMKELAASGKSILFITHKLNEIISTADRYSVLRKGKYIGTYDVKGTTPEEMSERMVGHKVELVLQKQPCHPGEVVLETKDLVIRSASSPKNAVDGVSFEVRAGEIVCIAGIDGNGQSELIYGLTGIMPVKKGTISLKGQDVTNLSIRKRTLSGISHVPEDRLKYGLVSQSTVAENMVLQSYYQPEYEKNGFLKFKEIDEFTNEKIEEFDILTPMGAQSLGGNLSGGNQQKVVVARELHRKADLFIAAQPIRGLDVGAVEFIHKRILKERDEGRAVLLVSFELSEVMDLSDRILVMYEGKIVANVRPEETTTQELGLYMAGSSPASSAKHQEAKQQEGGIDQ